MRAGREPPLLSICASTAGSNVATPVDVSHFIPECVQDKSGMPAHCSSFGEGSPETTQVAFVHPALGRTSFQEHAETSTRLERSVLTQAKVCSASLKGYS